MRINGLNGANTGGINMMQTTDSVSKNIQNQIANAQKELQKLSENKDMSIEEKMKKRQEIQQQINDLNNQLRQHQMEQRKEKMQSKGSSMDEMLAGSKRIATKEGNKGVGLSQASMKAIMSADSAMLQAQVQGSVATKMEGRAGILESEIKVDAARGGNVEEKQEELAEVQSKAVEAQSAQLNTLADANKELEAAAKEEKQTEKTDNKDKKSDEKNNVTNGNQDENVELVTKEVTTDISETVDILGLETSKYNHVDMRL
ncbi:MAG: FlxA-like family protein [Lachnospiraceae bacterium]|nr:FlxA-like family protein [Lachnospiraceae bacterium]